MAITALLGAATIAAAGGTPASAVPSAVLPEIRVLGAAELGLPSVSGVTFDGSLGRLVVTGNGAASVASLDATNDPVAGSGLGEGIPAAAVSVDPTSGTLVAIDGADLVRSDGSTVQRSSSPLGTSDVVAAEFDRSTGEWIGLVDGGSELLVVADLLGTPVIGARIAVPGGASAVATNPEDGLVYVLSGTEISALDRAGAVQRSFLLDDVVSDPTDIVIAPSLDLTDAATNQHLYVVDAPAGAPARLVELDTEPAASGGGAAGDPGTLINTVLLSALSPASPDSAGIAYAPGRDRLIVTDSEVDEMAIFAGVNIYEITRGGTLTNTGVSQPWSDEPTGAGFDTTTNRLIVSDDDANQITFVTAGADNRYGSSDDTISSFNVNSTGNADAEDAAFDNTRNRVLVVDGVNTQVYMYTPTGTLISSFDVGVYGAMDPEGIAYDHDNDRYVVLDHKSDTVYDLNPDGSLFRMVDVSVTGGINQAGIELAPASSGSGAVHYYIVDRGIDNDGNPTENDGKMYEVAPPGGGGPTNQAPTVSAGSDFNVILPATGTVVGTASDDGLPTNTLTTTWSETSGPGIATFTNPNSLSTSVSFSAIGIYVLRLTASDGQRTSFDEVTVTVTNAGGVLAVDVPVAAGADDAEQNLLDNTVNINNGDLELGVDRPVTTDVPQQVGLRFQSVTVPRGATIVSAYVQFTVDETNNQPASLNIQGQAADSAPAFTTALNNISSRARTTASVAWSPANWPTVGAVGAAQQTPSIVSIVQEIVDRPGWASGNALALIVDGTGRRTAEAYEGGAALAAVLHLTYQLPPAVPTAPTGLNLVTQGTNVNLSWTDTSTTETSFEIMRARWAAGTWTEFANLPPVSANTTSAVDTNLTPPGFYAYLVRATNASGSSDWLINVIQHTDATQAPPAPTSLVLSNSGNNVVLNWVDNSSNEWVQEVGRARFNPTTQTWGEWAFFLADRNATTYTDTNVPDGQYAYLVRSTNAVGASDWVIEVITHVNNPGVPAAPTGLTTGNSAGTVTVSWVDNATNEVVYEIQRARFDGSGWVDFTTFVRDKNTTTLTDPALPSGTYAYLVRATNPTGSSDWQTVTVTV